MNEDFNVDDFLNGLEGDRAPKRQDDGSRVTKLTMNARDNQGTVTFVPFMNKKTGTFYVKVSGVREIKTYAKKIDSEAWVKILPVEYYENLSEADQKLWEEVVSYYDTIKDSEIFSWDTIRTRTYALLYGIMKGHKKLDGTELVDNIDKSCLFIFPSNGVIDAMADAIATKCAGMKGSKAWIPSILNNNPTGRKGVMSIKFSKGDIGYDTTVGFEFNSEFSIVVDPDAIVPEEQMALFSDSVGELLGWERAKDQSYFDREVFEHLRDNLKAIIKTRIEGGKPAVESDADKAPAPMANQNGSVDPMKSEAPAADAQPQVSEPASAPSTEQPAQAPKIDPVTGLPIPF